MAKKVQVSIIGDASSLQRAFGKAGDSSSTFGRRIAGIGKVAAAGLVIAGAGAVTLGKKMVDLAGDAAEVDSKMGVVFGKTLPGLKKNLDKFADATGASSYKLREQSADLGALLGPLTGSTKATADMSEQFVKLATDLGSFNNVPVDDALLAIRSGLVGEAEPLRAFGVLLNEAAVKAEGLRLGLVKGKEEMTEQQKVQARASLIMQQTTQAQGDAERTAGSYANQIKNLRNNVTDLATGFGMKLLPAATAVASGINNFIDKISKADGASAKFGVAMDTVKGLASQGWAALKAINWGEIWNQLLFQVELISPRVASALSGIGTSVKTVVDQMSSDWGQFIAASVAGAVVFAQAGAKVVKAIEAIRIGMLTINPLFTALTILAGLTAGALYKIVTSSEQVSEALKRAESALRGLKSAAEDTKNSEQSLAEAKNRLRQATLSVTAAIQAKQQAVANEGASSQAAKQAEANVEAAYLARRRAALDVKSATEDLDAAQRKSVQTTDTAKNSVRNLKSEYERLVEQGPPLQNTIARIGIAQDKVDAGFNRQTAKKYAADMQALAKEAGTSATELAKSEPALAKMAAGVAKAATAQAKLALEMGKIPGAVTAIEGPAATAGMKVGSAIGDGMGQGIASRTAAVAAAAAGLVTSAYTAATTAAEVRSPSRLFWVVGTNIGEGMVGGIKEKKDAISEALADAVDKALMRATAIIESRRSAFTAAWGTLASAAGSAFDAIYGNVKTPAEQALATIQRSEDEKARALALANAELAVKQAQTDAERVAAQEQLRQAQLAILVAGLTEQAAEERKQQDARDAIERENFTARLTRLGEHLAGMGASHQTSHKAILKLFDEFGIDYKGSGAALGQAFADGILAKIKAVEKAAEKLAQAASITAKITVSIANAGAGAGIGGALNGARAEGGPVRRLGAYLVGEKGPEIFQPDRDGTIIPNRAFTRAAGRSRGGDVHITIQTPAIIGTGLERAASEIRDALLRQKLRTGSLGLA